MKEELTKYEVARIIGARALQLSQGAPPLIEIKEPSPLEIAELEFKKNVIPLHVIRQV
ncbi:MAG: DNA-directed RNA polymerase subunit K [Candidatus Marsarchaeota archaeon]|nr:DNA-directed RNA polymerase subunit K [Candidatus Marsarchaeota archaeon]